MSYDTPTPSATTEDVPNRALRRYEQFSEAANLADVLGRSGQANRARNRVSNILARHPGLDTSGVDVQDFSDWMSLSPGSSDQAIATLARMRKPDMIQSGVDLDQARHRFLARTRSQIAGKQKEEFTRTVMPSLDAAQSRADTLAQSPAISGTEELAMRSRIAAMVKSAESTRMSRIGSALGYGNTTNSPAAAALAADAAEESDRTIVGTLRDLGLQVSQLNRGAARMDTELAARIAAQRAAVINADPKNLIQMQSDIASVIDSLYSRDQAMDMLEKQLKEAGQQSTADRIGQWTQDANGIVGLAAGIATGFGGFGGGGGGAAPFDARFSSSPTGSYAGVGPFQSPASPYAVPGF